MTNIESVPIAGRDEVEAFLAAHPDVQFIDMMVQPMSGPLRGKRLVRHELMGAWNDGRYLPRSIVVVDATGTDCDETGLVWEAGDADCLALPVPGTLKLAPWLGPDCAQYLTSLHTLGRGPDPLDPRTVLANVIARFSKDGLTPDAASELEFYLCAPRLAGQAPTPALSENGHLTAHAEAYGLRELDDHMAFLRGVYSACETQGLPVEAAISEIAPGQLEIGLDHCADALKVADQAALFKRLIKGVANKDGKEATFMAKPYADLPGSGQHLHLSVLDKDGRNIFADESLLGSKSLAHAIAGIQTILPAAMAILAPYPNSWRRFVGQSYAPTAATWGANNRTVALRVTAGPAPTRHVEMRLAGADANSHLALAAVLAGAHYGLTHELDPGPPIEGDGYSQTGSQRVPLPTSLEEAIALLAGNDVLADYLGQDFLSTLAIVRQSERDRIFKQIPLSDYDWGFRNA